MKKVRLGDCVEILDSKRIPLSSSQRNKLAKIYPYYGAQGVIDYVDNYIFNGTYILVAEDGNNLKSRIKPLALLVNGKFWVNNHAHILGEKKNFNLKFIHYAINNSDISGFITGSAQPKLNQENLTRIELYLPDYSTQTQIAAILSSLDDKIETNNKIASVLEKMMKEIYHYWFVQFDFPDENGKPYQSNGGKMVFNPQLKRNIPQGWEVKKLGDIFSITMGSSPKGHSLNENGKGIEFYQGSTDFGRLYPTIRVFTTAPVRFAKSQDILMSVRAPVGAMNIAMNDCCIGRGLAAIHHESPLFAWYTMQTFKLYFDTFNGNGTTFGSLTSDNLKEQLTVAPNKSILQMFIKKTQSVGEKLKTITMENIQLTALRDFLLPLLMNGQASVR